MEVLIVTIFFILIFKAYEKVQKPKRLHKKAKEYCAEMGCGEVLVNIARIRNYNKSYGYIPEEQKILLEVLEVRREKLRFDSTPESIEKDIYEMSLRESINENDGLAAFRRED